MPDREFNAREKKLHKMTRDGLVERGAVSGEETRISGREQDLDLRQARNNQVPYRTERKQEPPQPKRCQYTDLSADKSNCSTQPISPEMEEDALAKNGTLIQEVTKTTPSRSTDTNARRGRLRFDDADKAITSIPEQPDSTHQHGTKYQQQFVDGQETGNKKLTDAMQKAEWTAKKLETAEQNLPARRKLRLDVNSDPETGKVKHRLKFEKESITQRAHIKGALPLRPVKKGANLTIGLAHKKLHEVEQENVATKAAHRGELIAEGGLRTLHRRHKTAPYRKVSHLQKKATNTSARAAYQQVLHDNPNLKSSIMGRMLQKRKIKRQYAKAAREAKRAGKIAKKAAVTTEKIAVLLVKRHPVFFGILALLLLLFFLITSVLTSCSSMAIGGFGGVVASSYLAEDRDIDDAELYYTEWETDLQIKVNRAEADHPGYDEYRYQMSEIGHDPYELMGFLTSVYQNFTYTQIQGILRQIFEEQYSLTFVEEVEVRYRTETRTDPETGKSYDTEVPYEWRILSVKLSSRPFGEVIVSRMTADQREICEILLQTKGNRYFVENVFGETNWLSSVTSYYGYRVHPISGQKDYHKAVDIGMAQGTEILAGHDGVAVQAGDAGDYGLLVVLEGKVMDSHTLTTKYAHCSQVLVSEGQVIKKGDVIAKVGTTGNSTGPHLHLEVLKDGENLNPLYFANTGDTNGHSLPTGSSGGGHHTDYEIPPEALTDERFAAMIAEAEKYLGYPYVWGGASPSTSFDCSGFVSWVINHCGIGWDYGRLGSDPLYFNVCTPIPPSEAKPGDLIFFEKTYDTDNTSHVGIYVGNNMMIHCGDPISYANIDTKYWQEHFYGFGRLPDPDRR